MVSSRMHIVRLSKGRFNVDTLVAIEFVFPCQSCTVLKTAFIFVQIISIRFDPHFNAITGLNGSGKSNILDSICFVLGITNLSQVRAGNLSELVYKQGQAGVNKATVTIVFNNEDKQSSPVGYEQCLEVTVTRQVLIGGKSKYLINGKNAPAGQVQNLFHSVQLNVNNPHFLIMQGRITKVLNMKPNEILSMVEEAAGTRMYETKRVTALKTIEKKQAKLDELNSVLSEEITPTLERLRSEKQTYLKWSKNNADIERMERFVVAFTYSNARKALQSNTEGSDEMKKKIQVLEETVAQCKAKIEETDKEIAERSGKIKGDFEEQLYKTKRNEEKYSKDLVRATSAWQNSKDILVKAENDLKKAEKVVEETLQSVSDKEQYVQNETNTIERKRQAAKDAEEKLAKLSLDYQALSAGITSTEGDDGATLPQQISKAHSDSKTAEAKVEQATMKIQHISKELKVSGVLGIVSFAMYWMRPDSYSFFPLLQLIEKEMQKEGAFSKKLENKKESAMQKISSLKQQIDKLGFDDSEFTSVEKKKEELEAIVMELNERCDTLSSQMQSRLSFRYSDPVRGFDRTKVKGLVAKLIEVKNKQHSTALEVVAGGKLFQVVVDEAITGKALLDRGKLERRVTIIPLDKIQPRQIAGSSVDKATTIAKSLDATAYPAIELVGFDEEVRGAIEYVFGSTLVVDSVKAANQICDAIKVRTVTLDGDVYDPSGTISGGSKDQLGSTLAKLCEMSEVTKELYSKRDSLSTLTETYTSMKTMSLQYEKLNEALNMAEAEMAVVSKQLSQTSFGMLLEKKESMVAELASVDAEFKAMSSEKEEKWNLYVELQERKEELTKAREERLSSIDMEVKLAKDALAELSKIAREVGSSIALLRTFI
jgi:structural maintenance of chromosome 2